MIIDIFGVIGEAWYDEDTSVVSVKSIRKQLENHKNGEELTIYVNSPGGSVFEGLAIYNLLAEKEATIKVIGEASSIASVIACAGKKVMMAETSVMLFHKPWTMAWGNEDDFEKVQSQLKVLKESIVKAYQRKTNLSSERIEQLLDEDTYHGADKCKELGFADEVYLPSEADSDKIANALKVRNNQFRKIFNLKQTTNFSNNGGNFSMDYKVEYENLLSKHGALEANFNNLKTQESEKDVQLSSLNTKNLQLSESVEALRKENSDHLQIINDLKENEVLNQINLDLAKLQDKIKPVENSADNNFALTKELSWLRKFDDDATAVVNGKTPYERKIAEISERASLTNLSATISAVIPAVPVNISDVDIETTEGRKKLHAAALALADEKGITYSEAFDKLIAEIQ